MIKRCIVVGIPLLLSFCLSAATLTLPSLTVGPVTYSNVVVLGANTTDLYFTHDQGIGNVKLKYLSSELQQRFHYDRRAAAEAERKQAEADALYQSTVVSNLAAQAVRARAVETDLTNGHETFADPISEKSLLGRAAPPLEVDKWIGDKPVTEGKYMLVAFWGAWSSASRQCLPDLNALQKKFTDKLVVVGVTTNSEAEIAQMGKLKPEFASASDSKGKVSAAAGVTSLPCVLLVDAKGVVRYEGHPAALTEKKLQALFSQTRD